MVDLPSMFDRLPIVGLILAGGLSSRMGQDKAELIYCDQTLLNHTYSILKSLPLVDCLVSRDKKVADLNDTPQIIPNQKYIGDVVKHKGPLGGVYSAVDYLLNQQALTASYLLIVPVDMPLLNKPLLECLINAANEYKDAESLYFEQQRLPLLLKANQKTRSILEDMMLNSAMDTPNAQKTQKLSIKKLLNQLIIQTIQTDVLDNHLKNCFMNVNTPEDWQNLQHLNEFFTQEKS